MAKVKVAGDGRLSKAQLIGCEIAEELMDLFRVECAVTRHAVRTSVVETQVCLGVSTVFIIYDIAGMPVNVWVDVFDRAAVFKAQPGAGLEVSSVQWRLFNFHWIGKMGRVPRWHGVRLGVPDLLNRRPVNGMTPPPPVALVTQPVIGEVGLLVNPTEEKFVLDTVQRGEQFRIRQGEWLESCKFGDLEQYKLAQTWANARSTELKGIMARRSAELALNGLGIYPDYGNGRLFK